MAPAARYARSGDVHIAYVVEGDGPVDILWVPPLIAQAEALWEEPTLAAALARIGSFARIIAFDRRGAGMSDPLLGAPTLEDQMDDVLAVMRAAGCERAAVLGCLEGGPMAMLFAASHPDRVRALVLYATFARLAWAPDYPWAMTPEQRTRTLAPKLERWGTGELAGDLAPSRRGDPAFAAWAGRIERLAVSPGGVPALIELIGDMDVRHVLPTIRVPTLVLHRRGDSFLKVEHSRYIARHVPGARYVELEGSDNLLSVGDTSAVLGEIEEFLTGTRAERDADRLLATVLFTDIVGSTAHAAELGDAAWRLLRARHDELVRDVLARNRGREIKQTGDGFLATFDGPARAIRCAAELRRELRVLGIDVRAGLHTGELELMDGDVEGLAVHIGARVLDAAAPGEVLVSGTVKDLVVGSGIGFEDRGARALKGVPGEWRMYAVA